MNFVFSVLFNAAYIEPALVTAHQLLKFCKSSKIYIIYLQGGSEDDIQAERIIAGFKNRFASDALLKIKKIKNDLPQFRAFHFDNSIIYKCLIPNFVNNEKFILNIDAGIIPGGRFGEFLDEINLICHNNSSLDWVIGGHCQKPDLPQELDRCPHSSFYPAGGVLLFNVDNYHSSEWSKRYLDNYLKYIKILKYAEQELMCATSTNQEILNLPLGNDRMNVFLSMDSFERIQVKKIDIERSIFYKCYGSFKPWKYFVLDPNKFVYTSVRELLEQQFPLAGNPLIEKNRLLFPDNWSIGFLKSYEKHISMMGSRVLQHFQK